IAEQFDTYLSKERMTQLREAALQGKLTETLQKQIESFAQERLETIRSCVVDRVTGITAELPSGVPEIISQFGFGDVGAQEQSLWFEVSRQQDGRLTLSVYGTGSAVLLHPSVEGDEGAQYQVPLRYTDLTEEQLD